MKKNFLLHVLIFSCIGATSMSGCGLQNKILFYPEKLPVSYDYRLTPPDTEFTITAKDGARINGIHYRRPGNRYVALYFHGNAGSLAGWRDVSAEILSLGLDLIIIDYRSFGKSTGVLTEKGLYLDGEATYAYALAHGYDDKRIILYGRSLGTGIATELALRHKVRGLILETPFTSFPQVAHDLYPYLLPKLYLCYRLDNLSRAPKLDLPTLVIHGTADSIVPYRHGEKLFQQLKGPKQFVSIPGGNHNDLSAFPEHRKGLEGFITSFLENAPSR